MQAIPTGLTRLLGFLLGLSLGLPALAQEQRLFPIPEDAASGVMQPPANGQVRIGQTVLPLAAGAQIRTPNNLIVMPFSVTRPMKVRYKLDREGRVQRVWLLAPAD